MTWIFVLSTWCLVIMCGYHIAELETQVETLDKHILEIRDTWILATTPALEAEPIEEISVDELTNPIPAWVDPKKAGE